MDIAVILILFLFGISVGSFLNVVADRVPLGKSIIHPPSHCINCGHELEPRDLFPIISYLLLRGKCRYCGHAITVRSMLVELATGLLFVLAFTVFGVTWQFPAVLIYCSLFIVLLITDFEQGVLPHVIVYPGIALALALALSKPLTGIVPNFIDSAAGLGLSFGFFFLLWAIPRIFKKSILGFGDVGMAGLIGASVGYPQVLVALCFAVLAGGLSAALLIIFKVRKLNEPLQFGPFLASAGLITLFYGKDIFDACRMLFW
ncbi:MAG: prepilin peptidase [Chloroflexi bacterium]|nr:prepilin peptidase [Chloroflexota bacterium]